MDPYRLFADDEIIRKLSIELLNYNVLLKLWWDGFGYDDIHFIVRMELNLIRHKTLW